MIGTDEPWKSATTTFACKAGRLRSLQSQYLLAALFGAIGRNAYFVGASWVLVDATKQVGSIAVFLVLGCIVEIISSTPAGYLVDRVDRRLLCVLCDAARSLTMLGTCVALLLGPTDYVLYISVAVYSVVDRIYLTALPAIIPSLVPTEGLLRFNALSYSGMQAGNMVAAGVVGWLLNVSPGGACFLFAAVAFVLSLLSIAAVARIAKSAARSSYGHQRGAACDPGAGCQRRLPGRLVWAYALTYTMGMLISVLASAFVAQELNGSAMHFGLLEAGWALGAIVGAILLALGGLEGANARAIPVIVIFLGLVLTALFMTRRIDLCIVEILLLGAGFNVARVLVEAEIQRLTPDSGLGRAKGELHRVCMAFSLLLYFALAVSGPAVRPSVVFLTYGIAMIICVIGPHAWAIRRKFLASGVLLP